MLEDNIHLYKKAGGTIIHHKPVFSSDSKILFIGYGRVLRSFSTNTGEHIQDHEIDTGLSVIPQGPIVDIAHHPFEKNVILCCFKRGHVIAWSYETHEVISDYVLNPSTKKQTVAAMKIAVLPNKLEIFSLVIAVRNRKVASKVKLKFFSPKDCMLKYSSDKLFQFNTHSWSLTGLDGKGFAAFIDHNRLTVINMHSYKRNKDIMIGNERYYTCVACHPTQECVAAGDNTGRVILYYRFLEGNNNRSPFNVFHWHTLPVNDIAFTEMGTHFYSGGSEHVLVKWTCDESEMRHFLPRLSAPVVHITVASNNELIALSTLDNGILIVSPQMNVKCSIQQFTWGFISTPDDEIFPCGLNADLRLNCIVTNGRPGHIQFYSPQYSTLLYNMDVCEENYVSHERNEKIPNSQVIAAQFSSDGTWLVTSQIRRDPKFPSDAFLKFWQFDRKSQKHKLKTCVTSYYEISKIIFQPYNETIPGSSEEVEYAVATLCSDNKFRIWMESRISRGPRSKYASWNCSSVGYYRDHPLADICFSDDGSILGAAFGPCLTLWDTESNTMKFSLVKGSSPIKKIEFGHDDCSFVVISATADKLMAWNLLSLSVMWFVPIHASLITSDPCSGHIAVFTNKNDLVVYKLTSSEPVYKKKSLCDKNTSILSAIFFPITNNQITQCISSASSWLSNSSLYFFTSSQELMVFEMKDKNKSEHYLPLKTETSATHFGGYLASKITSDVQKSSANQYLQLKVPWASVISQFLDSPAHTMPPIHLLCENVLRSLVITRDDES